jgi:DinB superfamily
MPFPQVNEYPEYFSRYILKVKASSVSEALQTYSEPLTAFYHGLPEEKAMHAYAVGKWTLKELLQHITDTERIMSYRLLRIARNDKTPLASFDENQYATNSLANHRSFDSIKEEFIAVRKATDLLIQSVSEEQWAFEGIASNMKVTANAIGFILFGHMLHHQDIVLERYL